MRARRFALTSCGGRWEDVLLTSCRPWSTDGRWVAVVDGRVLGPSEAGQLYTDCRDHRQVQRIRHAGYEIEAPDVSPRGPNPNAAERERWGFW
jgi:hypothetical protein